MNYLVIWNVVVFALYGFDKYQAKRNHWRVSESRLIVAAFSLGALGAALGMLVFRHKTQKRNFQILIPLALLCNLVICWKMNMVL